MSQPTQAAASASEQEIAELMNEIAFQKVLLASIDDSVQDRLKAESDVRAEIKTLEKQLRDKRRGTTSTASTFRPAISSQIPEETSSAFPHNRPSNLTTEDDNASGTAMDGYLSELSDCFAFSHQIHPVAREPMPSKPFFQTFLYRPSNTMADREQWPFLASASSTASTPNSADSLGDLLSPSRMNLPNRKRSHSKHLDGALVPFEDNKSRRPSPSPFLTGPTTPSTSGYGYPMLGDGYFDLTLFVHNSLFPL
jgi:hypothetical protein